MLSSESVPSPTSSEGHLREKSPERRDSQKAEASDTSASSQSYKMRARPYIRVPSEEKTKDYVEMRVKNNQACREWRQKRKKIDAQKDERILALTARVLELEQKIAYLNGKLDSCKK